MREWGGKSTPAGAQTRKQQRARRAPGPELRLSELHVDGRGRPCL